MISKTSTVRTNFLIFIQSNFNDILSSKRKRTERYLSLVCTFSTNFTKKNKKIKIIAGKVKKKLSHYVAF